MRKWYFCKQCGYTGAISVIIHITHRLVGSGSPRVCPNCKIKLTRLPIEISRKYDCFNRVYLFFSTEWLESRSLYIDEYVSRFPEFSQSYTKKN